MEKILTAEEFWKETSPDEEFGMLAALKKHHLDKHVFEVMRRYAKLHVEAALKAAANEAITEFIPFTDEERVNKDSILEGVPLLPPLEVEDDVEKLGNEFSNGFALHLNRQLVAALNEGFKAGYLKAREKYKFTEEDMKNVIECTLELTKTSNGLQ